MSGILPQDLTAETLVYAYAQGCFPMPDEKTGAIYWYRPDPRAIIPLNGFHISRSLKRVLSRGDFELRYDTQFEGVMRACAERKETWIIDDFFRAYGDLHRAGLAHSLEVFRDEKLVGGVYGVSLGAAFFAESMFHRESNMSKVALSALVSHLRNRGFTLLECQFLTSHLESLGAIEVPDSEYMLALNSALSKMSVSF